MIKKHVCSRTIQIVGALAAIIFAAAAPVLRAQKSADPQPALSDDESAVYSALLRDLYQAAKGRPIILSDQTALGVPPGMVANLPVQGPQTFNFLDRIS